MRRQHERAQPASSSPPTTRPALQVISQDAGTSTWDGTWHVAAFTITEERRAARNEFRRHLLRMGAALIAGGVYVCANDWDDLVIGVAKGLDITGGVTLATATTLRVGTAADPRALAASLWPLTDVAARWESFIAAHRPTVRRARTSIERGEPVTAVLPHLIKVVADFESCMDADPLLLPQLLPRGWPGPHGRQLLLQAAEAVDDLHSRTAVPPIFHRFETVISRASRHLR